MTSQQPTQIAEIVTFKLKNGTDTRDFLAHARKTEPLLQKTPGYVRRHLSEGENGDWTDIVIWTSMKNALSAAETVIHHEDFAAFGSAIDGETVAMRHEHIRVLME